MRPGEEQVKVSETPKGGICKKHWGRKEREGSWEALWFLQLFAEVGTYGARVFKGDRNRK